MNGNLESLVSSLDKISPDNIDSIASNKFSTEFSSKLHLETNGTDRDGRGFHSRAPSESTEGNTSDSRFSANSTNANFSQFNHFHHYNNDKKFKNYKLISDPNLKKGATKIYRYDGVTSLKDPPLILKDPRSRLNLWNHREPVDLIVPRFKIDKNYVGPPPAIEVSITNLNDNINKSFLEDMLRKFDQFEELQIFYHPKTHKHLGLAKVLFMTSAGARSCVQKLDQTSVMGNIISVFLDPFAKEITNIYESIINPPPNSSHSTDPSFIDPNNIDSSAHPQIPTNNDYGYGTDSARLSSETPSTATFDNQSFYQYSENQHWTNDKSPVRESLDVRIENLLRQHRVGLVSSFLSELDFSDLNSPFNFNDSPRRRNNRNKIDESDAILGTPPSPFMSASEYLKWNRFTKDIDLGKDPNLLSDEDDNEADEAVQNKQEDDDRMSLSSLSSGEKLEDTSATNPLYPSEHVQIMARLGLWKPGMGSNLSSFLPDKNSLFNGSLMPQFMYQSFVPQNTSQTLGFFSSFSVPSALGVPADIFNEDSSPGDDSKFTKTNELILNELSTETLKRCIKDLKEILTKDIYKKIVENFSYKMIDQWWEDSERKSKMTDEVLKPTNTIERSESIRRSDIHIPIFNPQFESSITNRQEPIAPKFEFGLSRGLRAAMPTLKLPSFKRKIVKKKSPTRSFDSKLSDISDEEDDIDRTDRKSYRSRRDEFERQRNRRRHSVSSQSSRSSSSSYSSSSSSSSSNSSSSDQESTSSSSYSDSEESGSESDSSTTSSSSKSSKASSASTLSSLSIKSKVSTKKSVSPLSKVKEDLSLVSDSDTTTADEFIPYMGTEENGLSPSISSDEKVGEVKKLKISLLEFEATEALIALSASKSPSYNENKNLSQDRVMVKYPGPGDDSIVFEHSYCLPRVLNEPEMPREVTKSKKANKEVQEKRKRKKEVLTEANIEPNVFAVASEWRKAKRKSATAAAEIDALLAIENKLLEQKPEEPKITFPPREVQTEMEVLYEFLHSGLDVEDIGYLKRSYDRLLQEETDLRWIHNVHWVDHPPTYIPTPKKRRRVEEGGRVHQTGCARTEGYYKLESHEKIKYSHVAANVASNATNEDNKTTLPRQVATTQQLTREARSNQRRLLTTVEPAVTEFLKFSQLKFRKKQLKFSKSRIHDWGLFALENIAADEMVIEYVGQQVRPIVADIREKKYSEIGIGSSYLFKIDSDTIVDATRCGNVARFINHSCNPNCYAKVISVEGQKKIVIYSKQPIGVGEEITYDYKFPLEEEKIVCLCRAPQCRGYLN